MFGLIQTMVQPDSVIMAANPVMWLDGRQIPGANAAAISTTPCRGSAGVPFVQATGARQPTVQHLTNRSVVRFDGTNDCLTTTALSLVVPAVTLLAVLQNNSAGAGVIMETSAAYFSNVGAFAFFANLDAAGAGTASKTFCGLHLGNVGICLSSTTPTYATTVCAGMRSDFSQAAASEVLMRVDDAAPAQSGISAANTGVTHGNYVVNVGARNNGASNRISADVAQLVLFASNLSAATYTAVDRALRDITGVA